MDPRLQKCTNLLTEAVSCRDLTVELGNKVILDRLSFRIGRCARVGILADNAQGKTTLLSTLSTTLRRGVSGELDLFGETIGAEASDATLSRIRRSVAIVWQQALVEAQASCYRNVSTAAAFRGVPRSLRRREAMRTLKLVGLGGREHVRPHMLNGGGKQLLAIACAIVGMRGGLLLADEPDKGLSDAAKQDLLELFRDLTDRQGYTIIVATHDAAWARRLTDRLWHLEAGRLTKVTVPPLGIADGGSPSAETVRQGWNGNDSTRKDQRKALLQMREGLDKLEATLTPPSASDSEPVTQPSSRSPAGLTKPSHPVAKPLRTTPPPIATARSDSPPRSDRSSTTALDASGNGRESQRQRLKRQGSRKSSQHKPPVRICTKDPEPLPEVARLPIPAPPNCAGETDTTQSGTTQSGTTQSGGEG